MFIRCDSKLLQCQILDSVKVDRGLGCTGDHSIDMVQRLNSDVPLKHLKAENTVIFNYAVYTITVEKFK